MGKKVKILICFLVIIIICLSGYIIYDKSLNKSLKKEINGCDKNINEKKTQHEFSNNDFNNSNKEQIQALSFDTGFAIVSKDGDVYINYYDADSYGHDLNSLYPSLQAIKNTYQKYSIDGYHDEPCEGENNIYEGIKLPVSNIISVYDLISGQSSDGHYLYFLKEDGTISRFAVEKSLENYNGTFEVEDNVDNLTNIVSIVQSNTVSGCSEAHEVMAIEKNGTQHIINK